MSSASRSSSKNKLKRASLKKGSKRNCVLCSPPDIEQQDLNMTCVALAHDRHKKPLREIKTNCSTEEDRIRPNLSCGCSKLRWDTARPFVSTFLGHWKP